MKKSDCEYFGKCKSCVLDLYYGEQICFKKAKIADFFSSLYTGEIKFFASDEFGFRSRCEFGFWHEGNDLFYTMNGDEKVKICINSCKIVDEKILNLMPNLLKFIKFSPNLKHKLFGCEFITTKDEILVVLLYHRNIDEIALDLENLSSNLNVNLIARSRKKRLVFGTDILNESLNINGDKFKYFISESSFIQPNRKINEKMIEFALNCVQNPKDLLEIYCGHGNFTIALGSKFNQILATEISKNSINLALENAKLNSVKNIDFLRMSAEELMSAFSGSREFRRLRDLNLAKFDFSHVLLDPPRAGCDKSVLSFISKIPNIIYISCNPMSLKRDLEILSNTHKIKKFAAFDQFAHTRHIESAVLLSKNE